MPPWPTEAQKIDRLQKKKKKKLSVHKQLMK